MCEYIAHERLRIHRPVVLRPFKEADREPLIAILMDADVMKCALDERAFSRAEAETFISSNFAADGDVLGMHSVSLTATTEAMGLLAIVGVRYLVRTTRSSAGCSPAA